MAVSYRLGGSSEDSGLIATITEKHSEISKLPTQLEVVNLARGYSIAMSHI
jgi:hypothetical protein